MSEHQKVLIVDDDRLQRFRLGVALQQEGYRTVRVSDGSRAVLQARRLRPDVIVIDVGASGAGGWETLSRLRREPLTRGVPVVIVSERPTAGDVARALQSGAEYYVGKPIRSEELMRGVRVALQRRGPSGSRLTPGT